MSARLALPLEADQVVKDYAEQLRASVLCAVDNGEHYSAQEILFVHVPAGELEAFRLLVKSVYRSGDHRFEIVGFGYAWEGPTISVEEMVSFSKAESSIANYGNRANPEWWAVPQDYRERLINAWKKNDYVDHESIAVLETPPLPDPVEVG